MKRLILLISFILSICNVVTATNDTTLSIKILATSDVHGSIFPYDFITGKPKKTSLANVYSYVKQERAKLGDRLILLDNGDNLQGQPTVYYYNFENTSATHLLADVMNWMRYDATSVGNHDIEAGHAVYDRIREQYNFPMLCANAINTSTNEPYFTPYTTMNFVDKGVKITILGLTTPHIPHWLPENLWSGMEFTDMVESARKWVEIIREKESPDVLIGLFHSGFNPGDNADLPMNENASKLVAEQVVGFDAIIIGHDHNKLGVSVNNPNGKPVWILNPANDAKYIAELCIDVKNIEGESSMVKIVANMIDVSSLPADAEFMKKFKPEYKAVDKFVSKRIGHFSKTISTRDAYFGSSAFVDLIHRIQLDIAKADISFAAPLSFDTEIKKGTIRVRDMFKLYKYENMLYTMDLTGQEVKVFLEFSYGLWIKQMSGADDNLLLFQTKGTSTMRNGRLVNPSYNFDSAAGILYEVDASKPVGQRIHIKSMSKGGPFDLNKHYKVAINSYRGNGGGGHLTQGAGIAKDKLNDRIISATDVDLRYYLMKWIESEKKVNPMPLNEWKIIPEQWVKPAAERDYKILFKN